MRAEVREEYAAGKTKGKVKFISIFGLYFD
jgi:hypothetical protein